MTSTNSGYSAIWADNASQYSKGIFNAGYTGAMVGTAPIRWVKNGPTVSLMHPSITLASSQNTTGATGSGLPSYLRPSAPFNTLVPIFNGGTGILGVFSIDQLGNYAIAPYPNVSGFTGTSNILSCSIGYNTS